MKGGRRMELEKTSEDVGELLPLPTLRNGRQNSQKKRGAYLKAEGKKLEEREGTMTRVTRET